MQRNHEFFIENIFEISTYLLIIVSTAFVFSYVNNLKVLHSFLLGLVAFSSIYLGVILAGTRGLSNSSVEVIEGLSRIVVAIFVIWHLSAMMRNLSLEIDPFKKQRSTFGKIFYGILFPPKELARLIKVLVYVSLSFYLIISGLNLLEMSSVDLVFFAQTERMSLNILFFGIQTPMMMASRASVSRTFSEYLKNLEWAENAFFDNDAILSEAYRRVLNSNDISYETINSNGKHLWITVLLVLILQAFETQITNLDLFNLDWVGILTNVIKSISNVFDEIF
jgi:hypothetical protein